ncbi:MAG: uroporphyrinogen decarboxylase family protein [Candidatus Methanomethylophilaceae archaeon]
MTPRENFVSRILMRGSERTPVFLRDLTLGLDVNNTPTDAVFGKEYDSRESARCVLALQNTLGQDAVVGCIHTYSLEAFGGITKYPSDGIPYLSGAPFDDITKMNEHDPDDIRDRLLIGMRDSYRIVRKKAPDLAVVMNISGPVNTAGNLRGIETFLMDTMINPDIAYAITEFSTRVMKSTIEFIGPENCDTVYIAAASDNPDMLGPKDFRRYSLTHMRDITRFVHGLELPLVFHPHGTFSTSDRADLLADSIETGIDGFQFAENNEPLGILKQTKDKCSILGGVDAFTTLLMGPEKRITRDTNIFLDVLGKEDYVLTCSCSLNRGLPIRNVKTMIEAVRDYDRR